MAHERGRGRKAAGGEREERGRDPARIVRHRQGRARRKSRIVLAVRWHPARLGRLENLGKRGQDLLIGRCLRRFRAKCTVSREESALQETKAGGMRVACVPRPLILELLVQFEKIKSLRGGRPCFALVLAVP